MPIFRLPRRPAFPAPDLAEPDGLLAVGGALTPDWLLLAYSRGIFPWFSAPDPPLWWSPDPRLVLVPGEHRVSRSLRKTIAKGGFEIRADTAFARVIERCGSRPRPDQDGTWITDGMRAGYTALHELGYAHSIEAWEANELVGGLYGLSLGGVFFGESMYTDRPDASKVAFVRLLECLVGWRFDLVDCQVGTDHLRRFGAKMISREEFLATLARSLERETRRGPWILE